MQNINPPRNDIVVDFQQSAVSFIKPKLKRTITKGCEKADYNLALEAANKFSNRYSEGQEICWNVDTDYFKRYGPGIYLFFVFVKYLAVLFCILAVIYTAAIIINCLKGTGFNSIVSSTAVKIAKTSIGNLNPSPQSISVLDSQTSNNYKLANSIPDLISSFLFLLFHIFWEIRSDKLTEQVKKQVNFHCYYTLQLVNFPQEISQKQIEQFFRQFGNIKEVAPVRNYSQIIALCQQIYSLQLSKHELLLSVQEQLNLNKDQVDQKVKEYEDNIEITNTKIEAEIHSKEDRIFKYYVMFQQPKDRQDALKALAKYDGCCQWGVQNIPPQHLLLGQKAKVKPCHNQPGDIIWQNQHITWKKRFFRSVLHIILVLIVISATFLMISFLNMASPSTATSIDTSNYTADSILHERNTTIVYVWCIEHTSLASSNSSVEDFCSPYFSRYYLGISVGILISLIVVGVKQVLKVVVEKLSKFQRYKQFTEQKMSIMTNLFITYIFTTVLITLLLQANIFGISFKYFVGQFINNDYLRENVSMLNQYSDFQPLWYIDIGYKITLTWIIIAFQVPLIDPIVKYALEKYRFWRAQKQLTQKGMVDRLIPSQFEIQDHYANVLLIIFVGLAFSAGMPVIMLPCAAALGLRYFYFKFIFIRFSKIPKAIDEALNQRVINMLPFALLFHFLFGAWMLGSQSVFVGQSSAVDSLAQSDSSFWSHIGFVIVRFGNTWHYTIAFLVCLGITLTKMFVYDLIVETVIEIRNQERIPTFLYRQGSQTEKITIKPKLGDIQYDKPQQKQHKPIAVSYKIQNSPDYFEVLAIMDRFSSKTRSDL